MTPPIQQQPQPYTGQLAHPVKGSLHITFEGMTVEEVRQKAVNFYQNAGLTGPYHINIRQIETSKLITIQITSI